jgi:hypothetical protein
MCGCDRVARVEQTETPEMMKDRNDAAGKGVPKSKVILLHSLPLSLTHSHSLPLSFTTTLPVTYSLSLSPLTPTPTPTLSLIRAWLQLAAQPSSLLPRRPLALAVRHAGLVVCARWCVASCAQSRPRALGRTATWIVDRTRMLRGLRSQSTTAQPRCVTSIVHVMML